MKVVLHLGSFSGLGEKSGGPMGGRTPPAGSNAIASRWSPDRLAREIRETNQLFGGVKLAGNRCTTDDFSNVIDGGNRALIYLDPPYFEKGGELYKHAFTEADHLRLADKLKTSEHCWVLSYDDHPEIRKMYAGWADLQTIKDIPYSINGSCKKSELLIVPKPRVQFHVRLPA